MMSSETALPQAVQELIERLRARLDRNRHSHGFACADCAKCADEDAHTDCDALLSAALEALAGCAQAHTPDRPHPIVMGRPVDDHERAELFSWFVQACINTGRPAECPWPEDAGPRPEEHVYHCSRCLMERLLGSAYLRVRHLPAPPSTGAPTPQEKP